MHKHLCLIYINYYLQILSFGVRKWQLAYCRKTKSVKYWLVIVQKIVGVFKREGMRVDSKLRWLPLWFTAQRIVKTLQVFRAVKTFLSSRLIMNGRRLWNSHRRHKFLRAKASRDILKFRVSEIVFPGVFRRYFPPWTPCSFVRIHARLRRMPSKCLRLSKTSHDSHISHQSKPV